MSKDWTGNYHSSDLTVTESKRVEQAISWLCQPGIQATFHDKDTKWAVNELINAYKYAADQAEHAKDCMWR